MPHAHRSFPPWLVCRRGLFAAVRRLDHGDGKRGLRSRQRRQADDGRGESRIGCHLDDDIFRERVERRVGKTAEPE